MNPLRPSAAWIFLNPSPRLVYKCGLAYKTRTDTGWINDYRIVLLISGEGIIQDFTYLSAALDDIKRANSGVGKTAGKDTSNHALCIVARVMNVTHFVCLVYLV